MVFLSRNVSPSILRRRRGEREREMDGVEMEMDIPQPDELEWLESTSHLLHDEYEYEYDSQQQLHSLQPPEEVEDEPPPSTPPPPPPPPQPSIEPRTKKRTRSAGHDLVLESDEKRGRVEDDDEDWLRYSSARVKPREVVVNAEVDKEKILSRFAFEIKGDFVPVTGLDGDRVYAKLRGLEDSEGLGKFDVKRDTNGLISEPIHVLMQRVETEAFTKALQASVESQSDVFLPEAPVVNEKLWVDKYSPSSFVELLSDEQTNREVLLWLKQWDSSVFGSEIRATTDDVLSSLRHHSSVAQRQKVSAKSFSAKYRDSRSGMETFNGNNHLDRENKDPKRFPLQGNKNIKSSGPPEHKILLLCGPPGLGKTTLAHVAAKHCGYRVVEINASDDRSSSTIEGKILDVVQMNSVTADSRPKCLVIDEIDGALGDGKGAVEVILKMLSAEKKSATGKEKSSDEQYGKLSPRKKQKAASLSRPVICICNDLYAAALRPLRQVAKVHIFVQPTVSRVVNRLKYICNKEGLKTSSIALSALAEYTECDIRSCLNTLQFLHKKKEALNVLEIGSQVVGRKDTSKSVFDIWKEIFQKRREKRDRKLDNGGSSKSKDFDFIYSLISSRGDHDLILDGVYENILQLHYLDPGMQKTVKCLHTLGVSDLVHQYIMRTQQMSLVVYQPTIVVQIHSLVAQNQRPSIEWPKSFQRYRTILMEKMDNLQSWHNKISPHISRHISTKSLVEDSISPLLHILSPPKLRPVAVHLLSEKEKNDMVQLVNTMVAYNVTYKKLKADPVLNHLRTEALLDASMLSFDPPLAELINFKGYTPGHFALATAVKQVLVHEVEKQKILQSSINRSMEATSVEGTRRQTQGVVQINMPECSSSCSVFQSPESIQISKVLLNPRQSKSIADPVSSSPGFSLKTSLEVCSPGAAKKRTNSSNFFDRFRKSGGSSQQANNAAKQPATLERDLRPLLFKFNEGYTNAVKRPARIREFLF